MDNYNWRLLLLLLLAGDFSNFLLVEGGDASLYVQKAAQRTRCHTMIHTMIHACTCIYGCCNHMLDYTYILSSSKSFCVSVRLVLGICMQHVRRYLLLALCKGPPTASLPHQYRKGTLRNSQPYESGLEVNLSDLQFMRH